MANANYKKGFLEGQWEAKGFPSGLTDKIIDTYDPRKIFPSVEKVEFVTNGHSGIFFSNSISPTSFDLDPYFFFKQNDFNIVGKAGNPDDINLQKDNKTNSVQAIGFRGPMYLSGWGYDVCGLPVPASGDTRYFDGYTAKDRKIWKSGPVDLRWDDERKVWTGGNEIIEGKMITSLAAGNFETPTVGSGVIYRGKNLKFKDYKIYKNYTSGVIKPDPNGGDYTTKGETDPIPEIVVLYNRNSKVSLSSGEYFSAAKINYEWRVLGGGGGGNCIMGKFKKLNCSSPSVVKTTVPTFSLIKLNNSEYGDTYQVLFRDIGTKKVYYFISEYELLKEIIPSESAGGKRVSTNGIIDITKVDQITTARIPTSGYFSVVAFNNCEMSSNVYTYYFPGTGYVSNTGVYQLAHTKTLEKLFDCPDSTDNFGTVTNDQDGSEVFAIHPFKQIKHNVRVIACGSDTTVYCNNEPKNAYLITEVDECANAGTPMSRE